MVLDYADLCYFVVAAFEAARGDFRRIAPRKKLLKSQTGNPVYELPNRIHRKPRVAG
jgi:hypothetical protein